MGTAGNTRVAWVDVAKGLSVALVVWHHVANALTAQGWGPDVLRDTSAGLGIVRMPLFFLASGIFATRTLAGPWRRVLERRVLFFAWLYVLWVVVRYVWFAVLAHGLDLGAWPSPVRIATQLAVPDSALWFIHALAVFALLARATRRGPPAVRIGAAAILSALVGGGLLDVGSYAWRSMALNLVFFVVGVDLSRGVRRAAAALTGRRAWVVAAGATALVAALGASDVAHVPGSRLVTSAVALVAGVGLANLRAGRGPQWLGSRTLEVYLVHGFVIGLLARIAALAGLGALPAWVGVGLALAVTAAAVAASLAVAGGLRALGAPWLFAPPWHGRASGVPGGDGLQVADGEPVVLPLLLEDRPQA